MVTWGRRIPLACGHMRRPQGNKMSSNENREAKSITCKTEAPRLLCVNFKKRSRPLFYLFGAQVLAAFFKNATPSLAEHRVTIFSSTKHPKSNRDPFSTPPKPQNDPNWVTGGSKKPENGIRKDLRNVQNGSPGVSQAPSGTLLDPPGDPGRAPNRREGDPRGQGGAKPRSGLTCGDA